MLITAPASTHARCVLGGIRRLLLLTLPCVAFAAGPSRAQTAPPDLEVVATAGGTSFLEDHASIRISADGTGRYARYAAVESLAEPVSQEVFTVTSGQIDQLWQTVEATGYWTLDSLHADPEFSEGAFIRVWVFADGVGHTVHAANLPGTPIEPVVRVLNELSPGTNDLPLGMPVVPTIVPTDICEQAGKRAPVPVDKEAMVTAEPGNGYTTSATAAGAQPGTMIGYRMSLKEAVQRGIVELQAKGYLFGDAVSIHADNGSGHTTDRVKMNVFLDLWGPEASVSSALQIEAAVESYWGGRTTSDGTPIDMEVTWRVSPGTDAPPGTPGYHQVKVVREDTARSWVEGMGTDFDVNRGTGAAKFDLGHEAGGIVFAHEVGHFLGIDDRYIGYWKWTDDGGNVWWVRPTDRELFTAEDLAAMLDGIRLESYDEILAMLNDPDRTTLNGPLPGHENDIMAAPKGAVIQSDLDDLAAQAGVIVEVRPGDILVNHTGSRQNMAITRSTDVFVPAGGSTTLEGLYAACIDRQAQVPYPGVPFDLAPSLSEWNGIGGADELQQFLEHVSKAELFCAGGNARWVVWRITDDLDFVRDLVDEMLLDAGVELGDRVLDFPHLSPSFTLDTTTVWHMPPELVVPEVVASTGDILGAGTPVSIDGILHAPTGEQVVASIDWSLDAPSGSAAELSDHQGETTGFTADVRGIYRVSLSADVTDPLAFPETYGAYAPFVVADERTETFEGGTLEPGAPFFWRTGWPNPWSVTTGQSHTGAVSATSGDTEVGGTAVLRASFEQPAGGPLSFATRIATGNIRDTLSVAVDEVVLGWWTWQDEDWQTFSVDLPAGTHTVTWTFAKHDSFGGGNRRAWVDDVVFPPSAVFTAVEPTEGVVVPDRFALRPNFPNPFNPSTRLGFDLPTRADVRLVVFDVLGREVARLADGSFEAGRHAVTWDAGAIPSGVYLYRIVAGPFTATRRMVLLR